MRSEDIKVVANKYANWIISGKRNFNTIPQCMKLIVMRVLQNKGYDIDGKEINHEDI